MVLATVVDWGALLEVIWISAAAGVGLSFVFSLAIASAARASQQRRGGSAGRAAAWLSLTGLCAAACVVAVVLGVLVMLSK